MFSRTCFGTLTTLAFLAVVAVAGSYSNNNSDTKACLEAVETVLEHNSPEILVIANNDEHNKFDSNNIHINVIWSHLDALFPDKSCISSYLLEYGPYSYPRHKRESIQMSSFVSPAINPDTTSYNIELEGGCDIFSIQIVVIPSDTNSNLIFSRSRRFWPPAYKTEVVTFFDSALVTWPDGCHYSTRDLFLEACPEGQPHQCAIMKLNGESPIHLTGLQPCKIYHFRLRFQDSEGDTLWTFPAAKTLPKFDVEISSKHKALAVKIVHLSECEESAQVHKFRVTHCTMTASKEEGDNNKHYYYNGEGSGDVAGHGMQPDDEDSQEPDYYNEDDETHIEKSKENCVNKLYTAQPGTSDFTIDGLDECTMYRVDISPADESGIVYRPGEDYESVHSTFCLKTEDKDSEIWFSDDRQESNDETQQRIPDKIDDEKPLSFGQIAILATLSVLIFGVTLGAIVLLVKRGQDGSSAVRHIRCPSEVEDTSPKKSLISNSEDLNVKE